MHSLVEEDMKRKMVFVGEPNQVGKVIFALTFLPDASEKPPAYLSWDDIYIRADLLKGKLPGGEDLLILNGIHKFFGWLIYTLQFRY